MEKKWFEVTATAEISVSRVLEADSEEEALAMVEEQIVAIDGVYNVSSIKATEIED